MRRMTTGAQQLLNDRYRLIERVGSGGMAAVYRAQDTILGRTVAVKVLHPGLTGDETFLAKFRQEAQAVANLAHPNIVTVHDIGQDGDRHYIVMEFVEGFTLKQIIRNQPPNMPMSIERALDLAIQICAGLGYAHRAGLVHCDVKPQNVLVTRDERVKVTDFGIARAMSEATVSVKQELVWGTPQYFAPEQARGQKATPASDVYSVGIILFEMLTGGLPFLGENHTAIALKHIQEPPPLPSDINPNVPPQLEEIILKVLLKEPMLRYRTAGQFGRILSTYRNQGLEETGTLYLPNEQNTQYYNPRPEDELGEDTPTGMRPILLGEETPARGMTPVEPAQAAFDWVAVTLGLIAFFALVGLIPLWWAVYLAWTS